jgi:hypothetical protein
MAQPLLLDRTLTGGRCSTRRGAAPNVEGVEGDDAGSANIAATIACGNNGVTDHRDSITGAPAPGTAGRNWWLVGIGLPCFSTAPTGFAPGGSGPRVGSQQTSCSHSTSCPDDPDGFVFPLRRPRGLPFSFPSCLPRLSLRVPPKRLTGITLSPPRPAHQALGGMLSYSTTSRLP